MVRIGFGVFLSLSVFSSGLFSNPDQENYGAHTATQALPRPIFDGLQILGGVSQSYSHPSPAQALKRSRGYNQTDDTLLSKVKKQKPVPVSPTALKTPVSAMKKHFQGVRERVARAHSAKKRLDFYSFDPKSTGIDTIVIDTPEQLKAVYHETFPSNHFTHTGTFEGVPYYLDLRLFDPEQSVMKMSEVSLKLETNLERMQRGCAPFSYKVKPIVEQYIKDPIMVGNPDYYWGINYVQDLYQQQMQHRLDIHHLAKTMEDGVTPLPSGFHHGTDFGVVVKDGEILAYGVSKKEARPLLKEGGKYISDCLHPDFGDSKIDRKAFDKWRKSFWKYVADLIRQEKENGTYNPFSTMVPKIEIFSVPSSQELVF